MKYTCLYDYLVRQDLLSCINSWMATASRTFPGLLLRVMARPTEGALQGVNEGCVNGWPHSCSRAFGWWPTGVWVDFERFYFGDLLAVNLGCVNLVDVESIWSILGGFWVQV